ncbi:MAG: hypothetical protein ABI402_02020 [Ferruginibacter sp.]
MNYSITKVFTTEGCDVLINIAESYLEDLVFKKSREENQHRIMSKVERIVDTNLTDLNNEIISYETTLDGMPEGILIDDMSDELQNLHRKFLKMENGSQGYGVLVLLHIELSINYFEKKIFETMAYINVLRKRQTELQDVL